ncbi:MAG: CHAT domain-containing protein [Acidobacteriota bacterium]
MPTITVNSPGWEIQGPSRGAVTPTAVLPGLPEEFLTIGSTVEEEVVLQPRPAARDAGVLAGSIDLSCDLAAGESAVLAIRRPSGALTFHPPDQTVRRTRGGAGVVQFTVPAPAPPPGATSRGILTQAIKAIVVKVKDGVIDAAAGATLPLLTRAFETLTWKQKGLEEGWLTVSQAALKAGDLPAGRPSSTERSLLFVHGTFSNAAAAFGSLAQSDFFTQVAPIYGDRIFAFDHFSLSRTPAENARMLLEGLPNRPFTFDVITHSRGGLVLRDLVERPKTFGPLSDRFRIGQVVLVASPNEGTPLATPRRFEDTIGWIANLLELLPDHPFTTGPAFVANGIVWLARHITGDLPGLAAMNGDGEMIQSLQQPPGPPPDRYSALVANCSPTGRLTRLLDIGLDQFFGSANDLVVPSEGGWRIDRSGSKFIPGARIGCFGQGGNLAGESVTHVSIFAQPGATPFLVKALNGTAQPLTPMDPAVRLPDRRLLRAGAAGVAAPLVTPGMIPVAGPRARVRGAQARPAGEDRNPAQFAITVVNGDLSFEPLPLLVGHYRSTQLTGTEAFIDRVTRRALSRSLDLGVYPVEPGTHQVFLNKFLDPNKDALTPRPQAVIVVGLGQEGALRPADLTRSVRRAVLGWAQRVAEKDLPQGPPLSLAATLMGSGGHGITAAQAAVLIAQGIYQANQLLVKKSSGLPRVGVLRLVELYTDRASEAWRALKMQADATPGRFTVVEPITAGTGPLLRPIDSGYRGADYDYIQVTTRQEAGSQPKIEYSLDTRRARTEVRGQVTQPRLIKNLVREASSGQSLDQQIGSTLYKLLVPVELEAFLTSSGETQLVLDEGTAGIPWEMLDDDDGSRGHEPPWAIRSKLLRKFKTETFRQQIKDTDSRDPILVIGEPACPDNYPPLPGAYREAKAVYDCLSAAVPHVATRVEQVMAETEQGIKPIARTVVNALLAADWRVVHVAGHGALPEEDGGPGGVVLSDGSFLGPQEIGAMRAVPELVFINCCHLGAFPATALLYDRVGFASGIARALVDLGVRCVVAAGWAVDDRAACEFATTFYQALLKKERFIDAVATARTAALQFDGNTWAAYQCYGDPDWKLIADDGNWAATAPPADEFNQMASTAGLELVLRTLIAQSTFQQYDRTIQRQRLARLKDRWLAMGWTAGHGIGELFAEAHAAVGDIAEAIGWYDVVLGSATGDCSIRAYEQRSNLRVRTAWDQLAAAREAQLTVTGPDTGRARRARDLARRRANAAKALRQAIVQARRTIRTEDQRLSNLRTFGDTAERASLRGAAMKRLAMVEEVAKSARRERAAIVAMKRHYEDALAQARRAGSVELFYPASNIIVAQLALGERVDKELLAAVRASLAAKEAAGPDFWSIAEYSNLNLYEAIAQGRLAKRRPRVIAGYRDLAQRAGAGSKWASIYNTATFVLSRYLRQAERSRRRKEADAAIAIRDYLKQLMASPVP